MWRRVAGGLNEAHHQQLWTALKPHLADRIPRPLKQSVRNGGIRPEGFEEMVRLAAALEHLPSAEKAQLGDWIIARLRASVPTVGGPWTWALGRLGARVPIYGSVHQVVAPEKATEWLSLLLEPKWAKADGALFAASQLARLSGDRARDLDSDIRTRVLAALRSYESSPSWHHMITEVVALEAADKARALGDTMPVGLQLG